MENQSSNLKAPDIGYWEKERPVFEANYLKLNDKFKYVSWVAWEDGTGYYQPDWELIHKDGLSGLDFDNQLLEVSKIATARLHSWIECAKYKCIPDGHYIIPIQPDGNMIDRAIEEFDGIEVDNLEDRIVFAHQAMIHEFNKVNHNAV